MAAYTTIDDPTAFFQAKTYTGNGSTQSITLNGLNNMQPDWVWIKQRDETRGHNIQDSVRGATKYIDSRSDTAEATVSNTLTSFDSNGFSLGSYDDVNKSSQTYVAWNWKAGTTSGITTTDSTITPAAYSFNQTSGFSIIKYVGNGTNDAKCPHGLGVAPKMIFIKDLDNTADWECYNATNGNGKVFHLNKTNAGDATSARWRNTSPDAVNWTMGSTTAVNGSSTDYVAYCFADVQGYQKIGFYTGNGSGSANSGTFVYTGFSPSFVLVKNISTAEGWLLWDNKRSSFNGEGSNLSANGTGAESTGVRVHFFSNGFQLVSSGADQNSDGQNFVYMSYAQQPFVTSGGVPATAR